MFDRVPNTPLQHISNQVLEHVKSPNMPYIEITFLWLMIKIFLLFVKFGGTKVFQFQKMLTMRTSLLYLRNFQNLEWENCDIILTSLRYYWRCTKNEEILNGKLHFLYSVKRGADTMEIYFLCTFSRKESCN